MKIKDGFIDYLIVVLVVEFFLVFYCYVIRFVSFGGGIRFYVCYFGNIGKKMRKVFFF